jgi:hypothetical protein
MEPTMSDVSLDPNELPRVATKMVLEWVLLKGVDDPALAGAMEIVRTGTDYNEAAESLESWFLDRLTIDPGMPGPFGDLGFNLVSTMLDLVDWKDVIRIMRTRED